MADILRFLTDDDRAALMDTADRRHYEPDEVILAEGEKCHAIFVIESGEARVERHHMDFSIEVARLEAGEIFGEMGFVEGFEASASVVADRPSDVAIIDVDHVQSLIDADPGFYGRFYQSLADILSRRLRETTTLGIAEFSWGGRDMLPLDDDERAEDDWGGGSPLRDAGEG